MNSNNPLFSFIHASDLHYETGEKIQEPMANARISCMIKDINNMQRAENIRFVLLSGDITNRGSANEEELAGAKAALGALDVPYHAVAGNHDLAPHRKFAEMYPGKEDLHDGPVWTSNYSKIMGAENTRFSFEEQGYHFLGVSPRNEDPDNMLDWLEHEIAAIPGKGFVMAHYGLYPPRNAGVLHGWGFARIEKILPRFRSIMEQAGKKIVAYLYGHNHVNSIVNVNGTCHVSGGGIQKGCTGYRLFKCYEDRVESSFHLLSDMALHDFNYWGKDKPDRCVDDTHTTVEEYHKGNNTEQCFTLPV